MFPIFATYLLQYLLQYLIRTCTLYIVSCSHGHSNLAHENLADSVSMIIPYKVMNRLLTTGYLELSQGHCPPRPSFPERGIVHILRFILYRRCLLFSLLSDNYICNAERSNNIKVYHRGQIVEIHLHFNTPHPDFQQSVM